MTYVIAQPCVDVKDRACVDECPVDCIYEGERTLYINADECVDCGACEPVCPTEAIFYEDDVPEEWEDYTRANIDFFDLEGLGSPGGAQKTGPQPYDDPMVAAEASRVVFLYDGAVAGEERGLSPVGIAERLADLEVR